MDGFNPRAPRGARPSLCVSASTWPRFQSACPARGTTSTVSAWWNAVGVSIRVPRAGHDAPAWERPMSSARFNPRAPRGARLPQLPSPVGSMSFNPRAPRGARPGADGRSLRKNCFNPRAPRGARPLGSGLSGRSEMVSIRVPRAGHDLLRRHARRARNRFNPRAPRGARRPRAGHAVAVEVFQSACPARGTTLFFCVSGMGLQVSIRVPRAGHDTQPLGHRSWPGVSIRVPRAGHDTKIRLRRKNSMFQSACPARGTTFPPMSGPAVRWRFNPRAPRGARLGRTPVETEAEVSIRVPRAGHDHFPLEPETIDQRFNPRAPRGARPPVPGSAQLQVEVSIRVPRAGHDGLWWVGQSRPGVSIRVPRAGHDRHAGEGGRNALVSIRVPRAGHDQDLGLYDAIRAAFQSACPARGTTRQREQRGPDRRVSIRVPRAGHDRRKGCGCLRRKCFNPRAPRGARPPAIQVVDVCYVKERFSRKQLASVRQRAGRRKQGSEPINARTIARFADLPRVGCLGVVRDVCYTSRGPSGSTVGLAPWCSTRRCHSFPRK